MQAGEVFDNKFRVRHEVGRGSFGIVYLVEELASGDPRAIKVLYPWAQRDDALRRRLKREARYSQTMRSPHVVRIDEVAETETGDVYMVMEFVDGRELSDVLRDEGPLPVPRVVAIANQILDALADAHAAGVIHRDLKPHNVFLCRRDGADLIKVFDFGIAKLAPGGQAAEVTESHAGKLTVSGGVLGTPVYMSPEQCQGDDLTAASDLYSLGIVLYELVTGRVPFDHENPVQVMLMHTMSPLPPLPADVAATPLGRAIERALRKDPAQRFASAAEFRAAIEPPARDSAAVTVEFVEEAAPKGEPVPAGAGSGSVATAAAPAPGHAAAPAASAPVPATATPAAKPQQRWHRPRTSGAGTLLQRYWLPLLIFALVLIALVTQWL